ncbi:glycosyltransferase family 4 protein [Marivita sp. GX14005]|uniref:glycosyltransferase family 4 protein n=1 Tax=Marivita sp. GX14005 TaxID=2942276 RepID=UPI00201A216F|nr:glycosyltransferase family 4 protein [Marivita sp. GX14005]MCL3883242.1 glycosyltransferase family 4 protein [Marivita sp. GX14005]
MSPRRAAFAIPGNIATPTGGYIYERKLLEGLRAKGRDVLHLKLGGSFPDPSEADMADALEQLRALEPDRAVILDGFVSATLDTEALARLHVPCVAMVHHPLALETGLDAARRDRLYRLERANLVHMAHVFVPSPSTARTLQSRYGVTPDRITVLRPGTERPARAAEPVTPPLILSVGIQHPRKGHDVLLRALARLGHLDWQAVIAGKVHDEAHAADLMRLRDDLALAERVDIAGYVAPERLAALYAQASIFALATRFEGYGLVFDEALAHGLPIVSCAAGAVPETVPDGAGRLVPPDDPVHFATALETLLRDPALRTRQAEAARQAGAALPGWSNTARRAGAVLDRL